MQLTGGKVEFDTTLVSSTITYWFGKRLSVQAGDQANAGNVQRVINISDTHGGTASGTASDPVQLLVNVIREEIFSISQLQKILGINTKRYIREAMRAV